MILKIFIKDENKLFITILNIKNLDFYWSMRVDYFLQDFYFQRVLNASAIIL
jgi:hypothetical protein